MTIMVGDTGRLETLLKKLRTVKGVKQFQEAELATSDRLRVTRVYPGLKLYLPAD